MTKRCEPSNTQTCKQTKLSDVSDVFKKNVSFRFGDFSATLRMREYSIYEYMLYGFGVRIYIHVYVYTCIYVAIFIIHVPPHFEEIHV